MVTRKPALHSPESPVETALPAAGQVGIHERKTR